MSYCAGMGFCSGLSGYEVRYCNGLKWYLLNMMWPTFVVWVTVAWITVNDMVLFVLWSDVVV